MQPVKHVESHFLQQEARSGRAEVSDALGLKRRRGFSGRLYPTLAIKFSRPYSRAHNPARMGCGDVEVSTTKRQSTRDYQIAQKGAHEKDGFGSKVPIIHKVIFERVEGRLYL
jgi:hypothetical protein